MANRYLLASTRTMPAAPIENDIFAACLTELGSEATTNATALIECIARQVQPDIGSLRFARSMSLLFAAALVFVMQAGFAMVCAGAVRKKNVQNTLLKNLLDACGASVAWFTVGYAFAFGGTQALSPTKTFIGNANFFVMNVKDMAFWLFQYAFSAASTTIIAGTLAERCQMAAYLGYSMMLAGWVYPLVVHSIWSHQGFLSAYSVAPLWGVGMIDFAGSGVVHVTGGVTALFATIILGPRRGRFHDETGRKLDTPKDFPGHSMSLQMLGTLLLWFGWYGFNCGSALAVLDVESFRVAALAGVNTTLSAGTAGLVALFVNLWVLERTTGEAYFDVKYAMNGTLCGLVAVTAGCGVVEPWAAVVIGIVAGNLYIIGSRTIIKWRLDDAVDAIPVHLFNGIWGVIAVGLFTSPNRQLIAYGRNEHSGLFYTGDGTLLGTQLVGLLFIIGWVMFFMFPFFVWLDWRGWFRSDPLEEIVGLDTSYHGGLALMAREDGVNPEYITAFKKKKADDLRRRNTRAGGRLTPSDTVVGDSEGHGNGDDDFRGVEDGEGSGDGDNIEADGDKGRYSD